MNEESLFERLLQVPLFQGIGRGDFQEIAERVRLGFFKRSKSEILVSQDELCTGLYFVLYGEVQVVKVSDHRDYELHEWMNIPLVLQPESLFGLSTRYSRTFIANSDVQVFRVEKDAVRDILFYYPTFRINYLNLLSTRAQQANRMLWRRSLGALEQRFIRFLASRSLRPAGRKELRIGMAALGAELLTTRLNVSKMLNHLQEREMVELYRERIVVPNLEKLLM